MNKYVFGMVFFLAACAAKDDQFCECLSVGEELNNETQQFFEKIPSKEDQERIKVLKEKKNSACADYQEMGGDEMRKLKQVCEE